MRAALCGMCSSENIRTTIGIDEFDYAHPDGDVHVEAQVPVRLCLDCGWEFTDYEGEMARDEALKKALTAARG